MDKPQLDKPQRLLLPFLAACAGVGFLSLMDAQMKVASLLAGVYTASLLRSLFAAVLITPVWLVGKTGWPSARVMRLHVERGVISAFMALSFFYALTKLPIAEAIAISFAAPLLALYLAHLLLGEQIRRTAIGASLLGFAGTLVIVGGRLGRSEMDDDVLLGLASLFVSALLYAYNFVVIRKQSQQAGPVEIATMHAIISALVQLLAAPFLFTLPGAQALGAIGAAALLTLAGSMAIAWAYARAEAQILVPVEYTGFCWAALFGWLFFREPVTLPTIVGAGLIVMGSWIAAPRRARPADAKGAGG